MLDNAVWRRFTKKIKVKLSETEEVEPMIGLFIKNFDTDFLHDSSRMNKLVDALLGLSLSDIKNIFDRAKVKCILNNERTLKYDQILLSNISSKKEKVLKGDRYWALKIIMLYRDSVDADLAIDANIGEIDVALAVMIRDPKYQHTVYDECIQHYKSRFVENSRCCDSIVSSRLSERSSEKLTI